jgi:hypothetical protein
MQRVRAGLTGLAAIFLMVLIAAAGIKPNRSAPVVAHGETLAVLGVAPGSGGEADRKTVSETPQASARPPVKRPTTI